MMPLPPPPPPYTPPPERWFDRHLPAPDNTSDTLNAMWLTLNDRVRQVAKPRRWTPIEREGVSRMLDRHGPDMMDVWRELCDGSEGPPEDQFVKLIVEGSKR